jgi:hypothetical protein
VTRLPRSLRPLFWEVAFDRLDVERHADSILARVLESGRMDDVRWLVATYGLDRMWRAILRAEDEPWAAPPDWRRNSNAPWVA